MRRVAAVFILSILVAVAQTTLNNESVVKMLKAGLSEDLVAGMIQSQPGNYSITPDILVQLKQVGVPDKVLSAMVAKGAGGSSSGSTATSAAPSAGNADLPSGADIGAYFRKAGKWEEMLPEVVNWKTGGIMKSIASAGVVKGDVNGHIPSAHSRNSAASPLEVVIYTPEGVAITEYQLIHLHEQAAAREFRTVTGGVLHVSGGATRDVIPFEGKKVSNRIYRILLPSLGAGEYGFLPPGAVSSASSASIGKMFTFRLVE